MHHMWRSLFEDRTVALGALTANLLALAMPIITLQLFDRVVGSGGLASLYALSLGLAVVVALEACTRIGMVWLMGLHSLDFERRSVDVIFSRLFDSEGAREEAGIHLERLEAAGKLRDLRYGDPATAMIDGPFCLIFLAFLWVLSPVIAATVAGLGLLALLLSRHHRRGLDEIRIEADSRQARRYSFILETLRNIEAIKAMRVESFMIRRYERLLRSNAAATASVTALEQRAQGAAGAVAQVTPLAVAGVGALEVLAQNLTFGALAASILLAGRIMQPLMKLDAAFSAAADATRRKTELDALSVRADRARRRKAAQSHDPIRSLRLEDVTAAFTETAPAVFEQMNFSISAGECIAVRGDSGSGKTLLLHLLMGWVDPRRGRLRINDARPLGRSSDAARAYLPTRPSLIDGTVLENMTRFQPERYAAEALELAEELGIKQYFGLHPKGLSLACGGGAAHGLPRSVEQRIPFIGALVGRPDVLLFDEANSLMDLQSDALLLECLRRRKGRFAMVLVTQRPSYMALADQVFRIEERRLIPEALPAEKPGRAPAQVLAS